MALIPMGDWCESVLIDSQLKNHYEEITGVEQGVNKAVPGANKAKKKKLSFFCGRGAFFT